MPMRNPPHPEEIVKWDCLEPLGFNDGGCIPQKRAPGAALPLNQLNHPLRIILIQTMRSSPAKPF